VEVETKMRVPTGIKGFDELIEGGLVPNSIVILNGAAGSGKTLFCGQFLYIGVTKYKEPGIYITLEQLAEDIRSDIKSTFGWDFDPLIKKKKIIFWPLRVKRVYHPIEKKEMLSIKLSQIIKKIIELIEKINAKRLVIDSISIIDMMFRDKFLVRSELVALFDELKKRGVTCILTAEIPESDRGARSEFIDFMGDMVINLERTYVGKEFQRTLSIVKMRRSKHSNYIHPFLITKNGIEVKKV